MHNSINLVETLKINNYSLMTEIGTDNEVYDVDGNLLVYQAESGSCMAVPNTQEIRELYNLPVNPPEVKTIFNINDVTKPGGLVRIPDDGDDDADQVVWLSKKSERSQKATKMLIELFNSPKYRTLMNNPSNVKLKVWEQIASELEKEGYKIAPTSREAGLRTFQKWRNMERTYFKCLKATSDDGESESRRKKPYFFDDFHAAMSKPTKVSLPQSSNHCPKSSGEGGSRKQEEDDDEDIDVDGPESDSPKRKRISDLYSTQCEAFPRHALSLLTTLVTSPKYEKCLNDPQNKTHVWKSIYVDMMKAGWTFGRTITEGALILSEKWRLLEKTILRKPLSGPRSMYTYQFKKSILLELEQRKALGPNYPIDHPSPPESNNRKMKDGGMGPDVIEALLKVLGSGHYQNLFATAGGKRSKIWEKIFEEIESQGFQIAGDTKQEKVRRLFQKWRNMKRYFVKYQIAKLKGTDVKKPMFYEMMFKIISSEVLKMHNSAHDSDEEARMDEWDGESDSEFLQDSMEFSHADHDYIQPNGADETTAQQPSNMYTARKKSSSSRPLPNRTSRSYEVLKQIKSLHETSLAMQQQSFSKIISLLENQISEQHKLNAMISEYITSQASSSRSKNSKRSTSQRQNPLS